MDKPTYEKPVYDYHKVIAYMKYKYPEYNWSVFEKWIHQRFQDFIHQNYLFTLEPDEEGWNSDPELVKHYNITLEILKGIELFKIEFPECIYKEYVEGQPYTYPIELRYWW